MSVGKKISAGKNICFVESWVPEPGTNQTALTLYAGSSNSSHYTRATAMLLFLVQEINNIMLYLWKHIFSGETCFLETCWYYKSTYRKTGRFWHIVMRLFSMRRGGFIGPIPVTQTAAGPGAGIIIFREISCSPLSMLWHLCKNSNFVVLSLTSNVFRYRVLGQSTSSSRAPLDSGVNKYLRAGKGVAVSSRIALRQ